MKDSSFGYTITIPLACKSGHSFFSGNSQIVPKIYTILQRGVCYGKFTASLDFVKKGVLSVRCFRIPWDDLKYMLWLPVYLASYLVLEHRPVSSYWSTQLPIDAAIPFCEYFVIFYCVWFFWLVGTGLYLLAHDNAAFRRYMTFLGWTFMLSAVIWFLIPNGQDLRPAVMPRENIFTAVIGLLYGADTCTNVFPSVHVVGAIGAALALCDCAGLRQHKVVRFSSVVLAILICASTVFIKQHAFIDVVAGLGLSLLVAFPVYYRSPALHFFKKPA